MSIATRRSVPSVVFSFPLSAVILATASLSRADAPSPQGKEKNCGTLINFLASPVEAAARAKQSQKLHFTLHISGNFEDRRFT